MMPPGMFPGLVRPGMQQKPPPVGSTEVVPDSTSQGDPGDSEKSKEAEANEENSEENKTVKGTSVKYFQFHSRPRALQLNSKLFIIHC